MSDWASRTAIQYIMYADLGSVREAVRQSNGRDSVNDLPSKQLIHRGRLKGH